MHTFSETGAGVPAFLAKLWRLVEDPETNHLIYWNKDGRSFIIQNQAQFARELLPMNYKHNNMASFIRQLNMYGFHKITSIDTGGLKFDRDEMEFSHPCFKRGAPYLLEHIKRKIATTKTSIDEKGLMKPEAVNKVLNEVKAMRGRQDSLDSRFSVMKQENEALWREIASLRQKHMKQQQIVNKLIQFLVTIVQPTRSNMSGVKRHFQLMINDVPQSSKLRKKSETGPVIHELTEELLDEVADSDAELTTSPNILSPGDVTNAQGSDFPEESSPVGSSCSNSDQPKSNPSTSNYCFDSNQSDDLYLGTAANSGDGGEDLKNMFLIIPQESENVESDDNVNEEHVLKTPMVKREMARAQKQQQLKQLKRQKEKKQRLLQAGTSKKLKNELASIRNQAENINNDNYLHQNEAPLTIKIEKDLDPLMFLECSQDMQTNDLSPSMISPLDGTVVQNVSGQNEQLNAEGNADPELYNTQDFITSDIPSDLFEGSTMINDIGLPSGTFNENINVKGYSNEPEKSTTSTESSNQQGNSGAESSNKNENFEKSLTLAKYNNSKYNTNDDIMRLSTAEDFTSHLDTVQDDLDNLRDILRSDGYSLDANTLLGNATPANRLVLSSALENDIMSKLFNDSDILNTYGLTVSNDNSQDTEKKGSELMTYQPCYGDFSDMFDVGTDTDPKTPNSRKRPCDDENFK